MNSIKEKESIKGKGKAEVVVEDFRARVKMMVARLVVVMRVWGSEVDDQMNKIR